MLANLMPEPPLADDLILSIYNARSLLGNEVDFS